MTVLNTLKESELLGGLETSKLRKLVSLCHEEFFREGTMVFKEGDEAKDLYILMEGKVVLEMELRPLTNRPTISTAVDAIIEGESFGWSALIEPYVYTSSARCVADSKVLALKGDKLRQALADDHDLGYEVMKRLAWLVSSRLMHPRITLTSERGLALLYRELGT